MGAKEIVKVPAIQRQRVDVILGAHANGARLAGDHRQLAEERSVAGGVEDQFIAVGVGGDVFDGAFGDDVEVIARLALADDHLAGDKVI